MREDEQHLRLAALGRAEQEGERVAARSGFPVRTTLGAPSQNARADGARRLDGAFRDDGEQGLRLVSRRERRAEAVESESHAPAFRSQLPVSCLELAGHLVEGASELGELVLAPHRNPL